jgi:hypothetical protein
VRELFRNDPVVAFTVAFLRTQLHPRLEPLRQRSERGASAVETAIIAAILIAGAVLISRIIYQKVTDAGNQVKNAPITP